MLKLSDKQEGDTLSAEQWDNHSKELENIVSFTNQELNSDTDQLIKAVDIIQKDIYIASGANDYTASRNNVDNSINELKDGSIIHVLFTEANTDSVTLDINGSSYDIKNRNGADLIKGDITVNRIIPLYFDGDKFISLINLYFDDNRIINILLDDHDEISNYVSWQDSWGENPTYKYLVVRGYLHEGILGLDCILIVSHDGFDTEDGDTNNDSIIVKVLDLVADKENLDLQIEKHHSQSGLIQGWVGSDRLRNGILTASAWDKSSDEPKTNAYVWDLGNSQWVGLNQTIDLWSLSSSHRVRITLK
jgi:hypothetical protein